MRVLCPIKDSFNTNLGSFDPFASITVLLLNDVGSNGCAAIVGWLLPLEVHMVLAPVLEFWFAWWVGLAYKIKKIISGFILFII